MKKKKKLPGIVLGVHVCAEEARLIHVSSDRQGYQVLGIQALSVSGDESQIDESLLRDVAPEMKCRVLSVANDRPDIFVSIQQISGNAELRAEARVIERMGVKTPSKYRLGYREISSTTAGPRPVLAVAFPQDLITEMQGIMPGGRPKPVAVEPAVLSRLTAFTHTVDEASEESYAVLCIDTALTVLAVLNKGLPAVIRTFQIGQENVLTCVQRSFGVDRATALTITVDGAFDITGAVTEALTPLLRQIILSRDFVERHEGVAIRKLHICAPPMIANAFIEDARSALEIETVLWNPLEQLKFAKELDKQQIAQDGWRFPAALGSAIGSMEPAE